MNKKGQGQRVTGMSDYHPHQCDFCTGTVKPVVAHGEPVRLARRLVLIEGHTIGKCDRCGHRYFPAAVLRLAEQIATHPDQAGRMESVPVAVA